ncbi:MAG: hypothetical protein KDA28_16990, partial [Phycisphaerales bacterium]|nr:hypothetical protein [Phycisphaerales bacterium]
LQNICERAVVLSASGVGGRDGVIRRDLIDTWLEAGVRVSRHDHIIEPKPRIMNGTVPTLEEIERDAIVRTLHHFNGHRQKTARALGIGVRTLGLKLKRWKEEHLVEANL